ncbi:MAG: hypothetical protein ACLU84_06895 [Clostridia bacterium]
MPEENKVILSLDKYMEIYEKNKKTENQLNQLASLILNYTELNDKKEDLRIDGYDMKYGRTLDLIKEIFPKEYETRLNALKESEE